MQIVLNKRESNANATCALAMHAHLYNLFIRNRSADCSDDDILIGPNVPKMIQ
jgi:hypothetical protein